MMSMGMSMRMPIMPIEEMLSMRSWIRRPVRRRSYHINRCISRNSWCIRRHRWSISWYSWSIGRHIPSWHWHRGWNWCYGYSWAIVSVLVRVVPHVVSVGGSGRCSWGKRRWVGVEGGWVSVGWDWGRGRGRRRGWGWGWEGLEGGSVAFVGWCAAW